MITELEKENFLSKHDYYWIYSGMQFRKSDNIS